MRRERGGEINFLKCAGAKYLHLDLTSQCEQWRTVDFCIPKSGYRVRGARPGNRKAGSRASRQLGVSGAGESSGTFVAHAVVVQFAFG